MKAKCYRTGEEIEIVEGFFVSPGHSGEWEFVSIDAPSNNDYNVPVKGLTKSPESMIDWLAHISQKTWFSPQKFFEFIEEFRAKNGIYNYT